MAANSDFCRRCEASYTPSEGDMGMCPTCDEQSEAISDQLRGAEELRDELDELDAAQDWSEDGPYDAEGRFDCDRNPPYMDNHYPVG